MFAIISGRILASFVYSADAEPSKQAETKEWIKAVGHKPVQIRGMGAGSEIEVQHVDQPEDKTGSRVGFSRFSSERIVIRSDLKSRLHIKHILHKAQGTTWRGCMLLPICLLFLLTPASLSNHPTASIVSCVHFSLISNLEYYRNESNDECLRRCIQQELDWNLSKEELRDGKRPRKFVLS